MKKGWEGRITNSPDETISAGVEFSRYIEPGDVFQMVGNLAAGKTTFLKGVATGIGFTGEVTSPTFTLINEYNSNPKIIHVDCYRENDLNRWINIGLPEYFTSRNIVFIEWADIIEPLLSDVQYLLKFSHMGRDKRKIEFIEK